MTHLSLVASADTGEGGTPTVHSDLFGDLTIRRDDVFYFPHGMLGFPECRRFALLRGARDGLYWLQSMEYGALVFLLVDPFRVMTDYSVDLAPTQLADLGESAPSDIALLAVVTLPASHGAAPTANLRGPIAVNFRTRRATQIVCSDSDYEVRCPVDMDQLVA